MTWFETEEFAKYVSELENALDEWQYDNAKMRQALAELDNVEAKIRAALQNDNRDKMFRVLAHDVLNRVNACRREIEERLMA